MATRRPMSARRRFEILRAHDFKCAYCGRSPPAVTLHVDHVVAVAAGGTDEDSNLVAACADCNLGKSAGAAREHHHQIMSLVDVARFIPIHMAEELGLPMNETTLLLLVRLMDQCGASGHLEAALRFAATMDGVDSPPKVAQAICTYLDSAECDGTAG